MTLYEAPDAEQWLARAALDRSACDEPGGLLFDFGPSTLRRAVWSLPVVDAALARFARAAVSWSARPAVEALFGGHVEAGRGPAGAHYARSAGGRVEVCFTPPEGPDESRLESARSEGLWLTRLRVGPAYRPGDGVHAAARWARGASNLGLPWSGGPPKLRVPGRALRHARGLAHALAGDWGRPLIAFLPGRRSPRRWGPRAMGELARWLCRRLGARAFVWPPEPIEGCLPLASTLPPTSVAALLSLSALCVGDDGDWAHVAAAVGAPTLTVHGPTDPRRCGPNAENGASVGAPPCRASAHAPGRSRRCLRCLDPADTIDLAERLAAESWPRDLLARWR